MTSTVSDSLSIFNLSYFPKEVPSSKPFSHSADIHNQIIIAETKNTMLEKQEILIENAKTFNELLQTIGCIHLDQTFYQQLCSLVSITCSKQNNDDLNLEERNLVNILKCDIVHNKCYFTSDNVSSFQKHIEKAHSNQLLFCFYCSKFQPIGNNLIFGNSSALVNHIIEKHSYKLKYQCNLCFYRAFSFDHILIHQAFGHAKIFLETIKKSIWKKKDDHVLNSFEKEFLKKINENEIDEKIGLCKIIDCSPTKNEEKLDDLNKYIYNSERKLPENVSFYCIYCATCFNDNDNLWKHFIESHPEHPIYAYESPNWKNTKHTSLRGENDSKETMINEFKQFLLTNYKYDYDDKLMQKVFDHYRSAKILKNKRKQSTIQEEEVASPGDQNEKDQIDSSNLENVPSTKRRRLFGSFLSGSTWKRTKAIVGMTTTAIVALGFYQFAQYLPVTVQKLLENK